MGIANARPLRALELIAASSREFSEVSGDLAALLERVARLGVEAVGDICIVQLLSDDGATLTLGAVYHRSPDIVALVQGIFSKHRHPANERVPQAILGAAAPIFVPHVDEDRYRRSANPQFLPLLESVGVCSAITLPLRADGQILGILGMTRERGGESYTEEDVLVAQELGTRAAFAIRNAKNLAALKMTEATYRCLADSTPASVLVTSADGTIEYANQFFLDYVGATGEELNKNGWLRRVHPADLERITSSREQALSGRAEFVIEYRLRRHDGVYRWNLARTVRVVDEPGGASRIVNVIVDIDDRHREEDRQRLLMEASDLAAQPFDFEAMLQRIVAVVVPRFADCSATFLLDEGTPRLAALACTDPGVESGVREAIAASLTDLRPEVGLGRALATGRTDFYSNFQTNLGRFTSNPEQLARFRRLATRSYIVVPLKWGERIFGAMTWANHDRYRRFTRDDLRLAMELAEKASAAMEHARLYREAAETAIQLEQANRAKDDFLGLVSHELRTPITVILGEAEVLRNRAALLDEQSRARALDDVHAEAQRLHRIVENLLMLARVERKAQEVQPVQIARELEQAVDGFRREYPHRPVTFDDRADGAIVCSADFAVEHAVRNYLSNADKYSPADVPIEVRAERAGEEVVVSVLDRGSGIKDTDSVRVFEPFFRSATTPAVPGVGIGLAVCKGVIEASQGRVWLEARPGGGTIAAFALRVCDPDELV